jgi:hypothetical protein
MAPAVPIVVPTSSLVKGRITISKMINGSERSTLISGFSA